eukprot:bmy_14112T0
MAGYGCLGLGLFCWVLLAVPVGSQPASSVPGAHVTTLAPPPQSEASMLSLNLGLNFKFHLRGPAAAWGSSVTETQALSPGPSREPEEEVAGGLRTDPLWELLVGSLGNSPPERGSAEGSSTPWASSWPLESTSLLTGPTDRPTAPYQPRMGTVTWDTALTATAPPSSAPRLHQSELELKFDMALRAGVAPTLGHRTLPLLPSLRASLAEIAGRLGPFGFFGTTASPLRNLSGPSPPGPVTSPSSASGISDSPDSTTSTSGLDDPSPASLGNLSVQPECGPGSCSIRELPEREAQPPAAPLPLFFLTLEADWTEAKARWGLAWEAHVYGVGALFGLVALLALLALALLPWRCPPGAPCLALLDLLLLSAGTTRAFPLFYDAYGHRDRDYTVDFRPPSPINLRRSIEEALCSEALLKPGLFQGPAFGEALPGIGLYRTASLGAQTGAGPTGRCGEAPGSPAPPERPSPGAWPAGSSASSGSLCGLSRDSSSMLLCSSPDRPPRCPLVCVLSPPRPSGSSPSLPASGAYQALSPPSRDSPEPTPELQAEEALLQEQFLDACRQIDELSMGSDTIDL